MSAPQPLDAGALIPWYLNGTLSQEARREVDAYLQRGDAQSELELWRAVQRHVRLEPLAVPGTDLGWRRLHAQISPAPSMARPAQHWRTAIAAGLLVVASLQTFILLRQDDSPFHRPLSGTATSTAYAVRMQVRFAPAATMAQINALLLRLDGQLTGGPSALGIYEVSFPRPTDTPKLLLQLQREPLLAQVVLLP